jgi:DNA polymerase-3 subunit epsilon
MKLKACIADVETTGLSNTSDEVIELGLVLFEFDAISGEVYGVVDEYTGLRDPGRPIPAGATEAHGLTWDDVRGKMLDDLAVRNIFARSTMMIAHNARFDRCFIERLYPEARRLRWICSMDGVAWRTKGCRSKGLQELLRHHNIVAEAAHRALDDARNTLLLLSHKQGDGRTYLSELLARVK